ncbi:MAG: ABC transporter substrate-binding protein/permease [Pirellulales bacterium]|nr:ABC transporter substrate-binding protein/permease [Pirellulales bacterium]
MKHLVWPLICVLLAVLPARARAQPQIAPLADRLSHGTLRWGGDAEGGAPFQVRDPERPDRVIGFEVELVEALAERLSQRIGRAVHAQFVQYEWVSLIPGLQKGDFDLIASGLEITPEARAAVRFSRPYYVYQEELIVRADERRIRTLDDCRQSPVGTMAGTAAERLLTRAGVRQITSFDGQVEPFLDLELGRVDAVVLDTPITAYYAYTNPKLRSAGTVGEPGHYGLAFRQDDSGLTDAIDDELSALMTSGRLAEIYRRWHLLNAAQAGLAAPPQRAAELAGLGFDPQTLALGPAPDTAPPPVDINIIAASAQSWTFRDYAPTLISAAGMTVLLSAASMAFAMLLGLLVCSAGLYGPKIVRGLALAYVEIFRGIPLLMLLFFLYFGLASYGLQLPAVATAILGLGMNYAAYEAQIYRTSLLNVPRGQWEAGRSLGMADTTVFFRVILPQAMRMAAGPMTNDFVALFKETSLVSVIAVHELTKEYLILARSSLKFVELGLLTAALYLAMSIPLGYLSRYLEQRWHGGNA